MVTIDLKDAYFTVSLCLEHQKFVRFRWEGTLYEFACLPFSLSIAPRVFIKIMKPVVAPLRQLGIRLIIYLDDLLIMAQSKKMLNCHFSTTFHLLENLGFMINYLKSVLIPATTMEFLGFLINSQAITLALQRDKVISKGRGKGRMSKCSKSPSGYGERAGQTIRPLDLYHSSCLSRLPPLPQNNKTNKITSPTRLAIDLWEWCLQHKIQVEAQYLPGVLNIRADRESRVMLDLHDWKLDPLVFAKLNRLWGALEVDLFASRLSTQLPRFYSWRSDPQADAVDAFSQDWSSVKGYTFPPFALIGRCLKKTLDQQVSFLVLVAPVWQAQPWYPLLLEMCVAPPVLLPQYPGLVTRLGEVRPLLNLQLAGWLLSSNPTLRREFQKGLKTSWLQPGGRGPHQPIR